MFPNTFMMQEFVRRYFDEVLDRQDEGEDVEIPLLYTIPKGEAADIEVPLRQCLLLQPELTSVIQGRSFPVTSS
jgi:hypothetical protein